MCGPSAVRCAGMTHSSRLRQLSSFSSSTLLTVSLLLRSRFDSACWGGNILGSEDVVAMGYRDMLDKDLLTKRKGGKGSVSGMGIPPAVDRRE